MTSTNALIAGLAPTNWTTDLLQPPRPHLNGLLLMLAGTLALVMASFAPVTLPHLLYVDGWAAWQGAFRPGWQAGPTMAASLVIPLSVGLGAWLGPWLGMAAVLLFLALGVLVPVFAGGTWAEMVVGPTAGYLAGLWVGAFWSGRWVMDALAAEMRRQRKPEVFQALPPAPVEPTSYEATPDAAVEETAPSPPPTTVVVFHGPQWSIIPFWDCLWRQSVGGLGGVLWIHVFGLLGLTAWAIATHQSLGTWGHWAWVLTLSTLLYDLVFAWIAVLATRVVRMLFWLPLY